MQLPSIVKQIGKISGDNRVYIEDYAYTYLNELKSEQRNFPVRVALYGHAFHKEEKQFYLIYGVSSVIDEMERGRNQEHIGQEYFEDCSLIGYMNLYSGVQLPGEKEGCYVFYDKNEAMQSYLISCYEYKKREEENKRSRERSGKENNSYPVHDRGREAKSVSFWSGLIEKILFLLLVIITATSVVTINQYQQMHDFAVMVAKATRIIE